jgi:hypothetical protein
MSIYRAELHVHTVLSPCADIEMIPVLIVSKAEEMGIKLLAITDHNAIANVEAVQKAAVGTGVTILPGMELQTKEEVHMLCIFDHVSELQELDTLVRDKFTGMKNKPEFFGEQYIVDETGEFLGCEERLLISSVELGFDEAIETVHRLNGLAIPAHVNRQAYGLIANLGMVPANTSIDALEISRHLDPHQAAIKFPDLRSYPLLLGGDVHRLDEFLGANEFTLAEPSVDEIRQALKQENGRSYRIRMDYLEKR